MNKWKSKFKSTISFVLGIIFCACASTLAETCQTTLSSSSVTYDNTTVQAETNELITQAGNLGTRVGNLESRFISNPNITFDASDSLWMKIGSGDSTSENRGVRLFDTNNKVRGLFYYNKTDSKTYVTSNNTAGTWGQGILDLRGNPTMINGNRTNALKSATSLLTWGNYTTVNQELTLGDSLCNYSLIVFRYGVNDAASGPKIEVVPSAQLYVCNSSLGLEQISTNWGPSSNFHWMNINITATNKIKILGFSGTYGLRTVNGIY